MLNLRTGKAFTRRESIKGLAAILAAGCAPSIAKAAARGAGGNARMARAAAAAAAAAAYQHSARAYVQDGLVAMYDGIENAGYGIHASSLATYGDGWVNLVPGSPYGNFKATTGNIKGYVVDEDSVGAITCLLQSSSAAIPYESGFTCEFIDKDGLAGDKLLSAYLRDDCNYSLYGNLIAYGTTVATWSGTGSSLAAGSNIYRVQTFSGDGDGVYRFGRNGVFTFSQSYSGVTASATSAILWYGTGAGSAYGGSLRALRVYNRALTDAEIAHNYAVDKLRFNLT